MPELLESLSESESPQSASVLGCPIHLLQDYPRWLTERLRQQQGAHVVTLNAEMAMLTEKMPSLATIIQEADLVIPDGVGVVFYLWLRGQAVQRCPGIELAEVLLQQAASMTLPNGDRPTAFFYGGAPGVSELAARSWQQKAPELAIAGTEHGYLQGEALEAMKQRLKALQPSIILVGMGVPRQELWIAENRALCPKAIWIGVGGSFDIWSGSKTRAPGWLRNNGLEWVYRLYQEPWRWRRMLVLPHFAWKSVVSLLGQS
ncbi:MAG: WecB/TagA/CpsF family glycosyltransferase [Cyanobacteria bacterium J06638_22]